MRASVSGRVISRVMARLPSKMDSVLTLHQAGSAVKRDWQHQVRTVEASSTKRLTACSRGEAP